MECRKDLSQQFVEGYIVNSSHEEAPELSDGPTYTELQLFHTHNSNGIADTVGIESLNQFEPSYSSIEVAPGNPPTAPSMPSMSPTAARSVSPAPKKLTRKRKVNRDEWKAVKAQKLRQTGREYVSPFSGELKTARFVNFQKNCLASRCKTNCQSKISKDSQADLCASFWKLGHTGQQHYFKTTIKSSDANTQNRASYIGRKRVSRLFYIDLPDGTRCRVCKPFYLVTHAISHSQINTFFRNLDANGNPKGRNGHEPANKTSADNIQLVHEHIKLFPRVESHYCRASSKREYLEAGLNKTRMYNMYKEWLDTRESCGDPVSHAIYSRVLDTEYNISFHSPKKDQCDRCSRFQKKTECGIATEEEEMDQAVHVNSKEEARDMKAADKKICAAEFLLVSFDLENVFALPRTNVSSAFYKRKLNIYNLTAWVHQQSKGYCAVWGEHQSGRSGNDIASALTILLREILKDNPNCRELVLWSDSCIAQNKNQMMSYSLQLLIQNSQLNCITHRYCEPGHSCIQDVDTLHSIIERALSGKEIFSPVSLIRHLKQMKPAGNTMFVRSLQPADFQDFGSLSKSGNYAQVRFTEVREIRYDKNNINTLHVKDRANNVTEKEVFRKKLLRNKHPKPLAPAKKLEVSNNLSAAKKKDLMTLLPFMGGDDLAFMKGIVSN